MNYEIIFDILFFSIPGTGRILIDLILPIILVIILYDGLFRFLAKKYLIDAVFKKELKRILMHAAGRIILIYAMVYVVYGFIVLLENYLLIILGALVVIFLFALYLLPKFIWTSQPKYRREKGMHIHDWKNRWR